ncbi:DUF1501 domain-containing protein [Paenibacillus elgii]
MAFSAFGRRVKENGNGSTDHGTAAPVFVLGGKIKGGLYGVMPSLTNLDNSDLKYQVDFAPCTTPSSTNGSTATRPVRSGKRMNGSGLCKGKRRREKVPSAAVFLRKPFNLAGRCYFIGNILNIRDIDLSIVVHIESSVKSRHTGS